MGNTLSASDYVHLHNHTHHSLLDGLTKVDELVSRVKDLGMNACAITDHGTMSGAIEFYKSATKAGIKPIIGIEAYVAARTRFDRDPSKDKARYHLILLAMNDVGYRNLMMLSSKANLEGMYYKPRIDHDLLEQYNEGIIALSACASGEVGENLRADNYEEAKRIAAWYKSVFGDRYYLELQDHGHPDAPTPWDVQVKINGYLHKISEELDIPCVVTSDGHYISHDDQDAHEILLCVGTGAYLSDEKRMSLKDFELHVTDPKDIISRWEKTNTEAVMNAKRIADRCDLTIDLGGILIPTFPVPEGETEKTYLDKLVYRGLAQRYLLMDKAETDTLDPADIRPRLANDVTERLDMELDVLDRMGYNGYFLIVQDFINWGKDQGIIFGPGRGSAAGSIIAYSLRITDLDPLKYDLLFERFLNPDRISMPDIDIDIQDTRRGEVIEYCANKYGTDRVANIVTFGKMAARAAVRDVARVLQVPYAEADRLSKMIPPPVQGRHIPLAKSVKDDADLKAEYESNPTAKEVFDYAIRLEGTIRSHGVHAAGVVIAPDDIVKYAPLEMAQKGVVATQYPMGPVEELGLLKMDFLGLSNLTIINNALRIVKKVYKDDIILSEIPLDDQKTYELLQRGDTTGVFQLESAGMKRYLKELKPTVFDDIIAMVALYRPGPMQFIDSFIKRKHGEEAINYLHPKMENALSSTYGILVYQEQFMQISKDLAGFTGGQADTLRKAVGKKIIEMMRKVKPEFIEGAIKHSDADRRDMEKFWAQLEEFANYCFNKSHAACYGLISYWTAYLKAHYPDAFMAALMTSDQDDIDRLAIEITECRHMGITVLAPDVNESYVEFAVVPGESTIRFGMAAVKGVGVGAVEEILRARDEKKFTSVEDFARRVSTTKFNKKAWESLIKSGGFDSFGDRSDLLFNLESIQGFASKLQKDALSGQTDLFGGLVDSAMVQPSVTLQAAPAKHTMRE
jgi:DNA polymerase-3 subunit alpha